MKAAAAPVTKRAVSSIHPSLAKPPRPEKSRKTVSAVRKTLRFPYISATRPPSSISPA